MTTESQDSFGRIAGQELIGSLFRIANRAVSPLTERIIDEPVSDRNAVNAAIDYNRLNGSGPVDPVNAARSPQTLGQFLFGSPAGGTAPNPSGNGSMMLPILLVVALVVVLFLKK